MSRSCGRRVGRWAVPLARRAEIAARAREGPSAATLCPASPRSNLPALVAWRLESGVWRLVPGARCLAAWCVVLGVLRLARCLRGSVQTTSAKRPWVPSRVPWWRLGAWCLVPGAWCLVLGAWCSALGARCLVLGARRSVLDARCLVLGAAGRTGGACQACPAKGRRSATSPQPSPAADERPVDSQLGVMVSRVQGKGRAGWRESRW